MKFKVLYIITFISLSFLYSNAQRGVRIGYIDTEYILENVPEYQEANSQLDKKVLQWKSEVEKRLKSIEQQRDEVEKERILLTRELYDEKMEDIAFEEEQILDYQQKRFGPNGDLMIQKRQLIEPIQDQIFAVVQEIATLKKFDFIFDKSADVVMLYSAERYDISEQVLRTLNRAAKREQVKNKKERKALEDEEVVPEIDQTKDERQQALDAKREERNRRIEERKKQQEERRQQQEELREAKKREKEERRQKILEDRKSKSEGEKETKNIEKEVTSEVDKVSKGIEKIEEQPKTRAEIQAEINERKAAEREARKKALEERKKEVLDRRKKALEERKRQKRERDSIIKAQRETKNNN